MIENKSCDVNGVAHLPFGQISNSMCCAWLMEIKNYVKTKDVEAIDIV